MRRTVTLLLTISCLIFSANVLAKKSYYTVGQMASDCQLYLNLIEKKKDFDKKDAYKAMSCAFLIKGFRAGIFFQNRQLVNDQRRRMLNTIYKGGALFKSHNLFCYNNHVKSRQIAKIIVRAADAHPELLHKQYISMLTLIVYAKKYQDIFFNKACYAKFQGYLDKSGSKDQPKISLFTDK